MWQYKIWSYSVTEHETARERLNELGAEGWQLVAVTPHGQEHVVYMARSVVEGGTDATV